MQGANVPPKIFLPESYIAGSLSFILANVLRIAASTVGVNSSPSSSSDSALSESVDKPESEVSEW